MSTPLGFVISVFRNSLDLLYNGWRSIVLDSENNLSVFDLFLIVVALTLFFNMLRELIGASNGISVSRVGSANFGDDKPVKINNNDSPEGLYNKFWE